MPARGLKAMPAIRVTITLPYYLRLAEGDYSWSGGAETVRVLAPELAEGTPPQTSVQANFVNLDTADPNEIQREKEHDAEPAPSMDKPLVAAVSGGYPACRHYRNHSCTGQPLPL